MYSHWNEITNLISVDSLGDVNRACLPNFKTESN